MESASLYQQRAAHYDRIYHFKDYAAESERVRRILAERGIEDGARVVEAACGTGAHLRLLRQHYRVAGFDLHEEMLALARDKLADGGAFGDIPLWQADMASFELDEPADAILCLFSSIGYVYPHEQLVQAAHCFYGAVRPAGVVLIEPFLTPDLMKEGHAAMQLYDGEDVKLVRACVSRCEGQRAVFDFHWLATTPHVGVEHWVERHELWLYTRDEMLGAFCTAGFDASFTDEGLMPERGLLIATRA